MPAAHRLSAVAPVPVDAADQVKPSLLAASLGDPAEIVHLRPRYQQLVFRAGTCCIVPGTQIAAPIIK